MKYFHYFDKKKGPTNKENLRKKFKNFVLELKVRGFSEKSIDSYLYYNGKFLEFIEKEPKRVSSMDIKAYLNYLVLNGSKERTVNMVINSLKAYYEGFLRKRLFKNIKRSKIPKNLPFVLSKNEIKIMIDNARFLKHKLLIELIYSSGIRVGEAVKIKIENINTNEKTIFIKQGKGKKDRFVIASNRFIQNLKRFVSKKSSGYLFQNSYGKHISIRTAEEIIRLAAKRAGIKKRVYPHLLRASFATHLLESEVPIQKVQKLLGHSRLTTTMGYIRTQTNDLKNVRSPLDDI